MRAIHWAVVAVVLGIAAQSRAGFIISHTMETGTGSLTGYHIFRFYALNTRGSGSRDLTGVDVSIQSSGGPPLMQFRDYNHNGYVDANLGGVGLNDFNPVASFVKIGEDGDQFAVYGVPIRLEGSSTNDPVTYYTGRTEFRVASLNSVGHRPDATTDQGARFAVVIAPLDSDVHLIGEICDSEGVSGIGGAAIPASSLSGDFLPGESGVNLGAAPSASDPVPAFGTVGWTQMDYLAQVPEPTGLLPLGLLAIGLLRRARRQA